MIITTHCYNCMIISKWSVLAGYVNKEDKEPSALEFTERGELLLQNTASGQSSCYICILGVNLSWNPLCIWFSPPWVGLSDSCCLLEQPPLSELCLFLFQSISLFIFIPYFRYVVVTCCIRIQL